MKESWDTSLNDRKCLNLAYSLVRPKGYLSLYPFKLHVQHCRIDARKYFFSSRVIIIWNQLPAEVFNADTVAAFVAKLRSCDLSCYLL